MQNLDAALLEFFRQHDSGNRVDRASFLSAHPDIAEQLNELLKAADLVEEMAGPTLIHPDPANEPMQSESPSGSENSEPDSLDNTTKQIVLSPSRKPSTRVTYLPSFVLPRRSCS